MKKVLLKGVSGRGAETAELVRRGGDAEAQRKQNKFLINLDKSAF